MEKKLCPSCTKTNDENSDFCFNCGAPLDFTATMDPIKQIRTQDFIARSLSKRFPKTFIIAFWLLFGSFFFLSFLFFMQIFTFKHPFFLFGIIGMWFSGYLLQMATDKYLLLRPNSKLLWKIGLILYLLLLFVDSRARIIKLNVANYSYFVVNFISLLGFIGFSFNVRIFNKIFWTIFTWIFAAWALIPTLHKTIFRENYALDGLSRLCIICLFLSPAFLAIFFYSKKFDNLATKK